MKAFVKISYIYILFFNFYTCITYPPVTETHKKWYSAYYDYTLTRVEKSGLTINIDTTDSSLYNFKDSLINIEWSIKHNKLSFDLVNNTLNTLSINWDNIIFVDINGKNSRVIHSGIKFNEKEKPQVPSNVIRLGSLNDILIPIEKISYFKGYESPRLYLPSEWLAGPIIPTCCSQNKQETELLASENVGKIFQLLFQIEINNNLYDYIFSFKIGNYKISEDLDCPSNRID